jgi:hypothetical protein
MILQDTAELKLLESIKINLNKLNLHNLLKLFHLSMSQIDCSEIVSVKKQVELIFQKKVTLLKKPKWENDSFILVIENPENPSKRLAIKIHQDFYPVCNHLYANKDLLNKFEKSGHISKVYSAPTIFDNTGTPYKCVCYDLIEGCPLDKLVPNAEKFKIENYRKLLKECTLNLLMAGGNIFIKDLGDFIFDGEKILVSDINAIFDISMADMHSKKSVMFVVDKIIDKIVVPEYVPFDTIRPTLA